MNPDPRSENGAQCPTCHKGRLWPRVIEEERFLYEADGEKVTVVAENVPVRECDNPACGERLSGPEAARIRHEAICRALGLLTPAEIRALRERLGLSAEQFARLTGIGKATIHRWEGGRLLQNRAMDRYLRLVQQNPGNVDFLRRLQDSSGAAEEPRPRFRCKPRLARFQLITEAN